MRWKWFSKDGIALVKADDMVLTSCRGKEAILLIDSVVGRGDRFSRLCEKLVEDFVNALIRVVVELVIHHTNFRISLRSHVFLSHYEQYGMHS